MSFHNLVYTSKSCFPLYDMDQNNYGNIKYIVIMTNKGYTKCVYIITPGQGFSCYVMTINNAFLLFDQYTAHRLQLVLLSYYIDEFNLFHDGLLICESTATDKKSV